MTLPQQTQTYRIRSLAIATTLLASPLVAACAGAPTADPAGRRGNASPLPAQPLCDDWGTDTFFESASPQDVQVCLEAGADPDGPRDMYWGPPFHTAARVTQHPEVIALLVGAGADVDVRNWRGMTPLHSAAERNSHAGVLAALLEAGADPNGRDLDGITPLHMAATNSDNEQIVTALVQAGADINARGPLGLTPLHMAWSHPGPGNRAAVVQELLSLGADRLALNDGGQIADPTHCNYWDTDTFAHAAVPADFARCLEQGADVNARDERDNTVLHRATGNEDASVIGVLLDAGAELETRNSNGLTPLHSAISNSNPAAVAALLQAGADINADAGSFYGTPLTHAALQIRRYTSPRNAATIAIIDQLLEAGADVNAVDERGDTPFLKVLRSGGTGTMADSTAALALKLLEAGTDPDAPGARLTTPLHAAAGSGAPLLVDALLDAGADPDARNEDGNSPLHRAARTGSPEMVAQLVDAGADVNGRNTDGQSPLHLAVLGGERLFNAAMEAQLLEYFELTLPQEETPPWQLRAAALLELGADPNSQDAEGNTPLHLATGALDTVLASLLVDAGADVNARNESDETPLMVARNHANEPVVRKLLDLGADPGVLAATGGTEGPLCDLTDRMLVQRAPVESLTACLVAGFSSDLPDWGGQTPLLTLVGSGPDPTILDKIQLLLAAGADANARTRSGHTALHHAAGGRGESYSPGWDGPAGLAAATALLEAGADVNARDSRGETPLHGAARWQSRDTISMESLLLAAGADVNARANDGATPLHLAAALDHVPAVSVLLEAGAEIDARTSTGLTPLRLAMQNTRRAAVARLLEAGADPDARDLEGRPYDPISCERWGTPPFFAFATVDIVTACLDSGADPRVVRQPRPSASTGGRLVAPVRTGTPLHVAAAHARDPAVITTLVRAGADVNARDNSDSTPLHAAAETGTAGVVRALLEAGAEVDARPRRYVWFFGPGRTPLHNAASNPDPEVAAALLDAGADVGSRGPGGVSPLHSAATRGNAAVAALLLDAGADVNARSSTGLTPLHHAAGSRSSDLIEMLLEAGADVHARGWYGVSHSVQGNVTPLHVAAYRNPNPEIVTMLVAAGADPNGEVPRAGRFPNQRTTSFPGKPRSPLHLAAGSNTPAVIEALLRAGADLELTDSDGRTVLHHAAVVFPAAFPLLLRLGADPQVRDAAGKTPMDYARENPALHPWERVRMSTPLGRR